MPPQIAFSAAAGDMLCGMGLGFLVGVLRCFFPACRGMAAFWADFFAAGAALILLQGYAAQYAAAGELRWYLPAAALLGGISAWCVFQPVVLAVLLALKKAITFVLFAPVRCVARGVKRCVVPPRKKAMKKRKKQLQSEQKVLYNSNV